MERVPEPPAEDREEHNRLGFYKADEDETYNERAGTQGEPPDDEVEQRLVDET